MKNFTFPVLLFLPAFLFLIMFMGTVPVLADTNASVAAGENHSLLLRTDGSLWSMGKNDRGQLGNGSELERGLVGWWKFDGDATDSTGNGNDGTVNGATLTTDRYGQANSAYSFDGVDDYIETPSINWGFDNTVTVSVWIRNDFNSVSGSLLSLGRTHQSDEILLYIRDNNSVEFYSHKSTGNWARKEFSLNSQDWLNLVSVYDGGFSSDEILVYLNGEQQPTSYLTSGVPSLLSDITPRMLRIGARVASPANEFFNGSIDDIRIYNRALSSSEVSALYSLESSPPSYEPVKIVDENVTAIASGSETSYFIKNDGSLWGMGRNDRGQLGNVQGLDQGLVGWWKFDGDATDSSGNGNDGTVNGATLTTDRHGQANEAYSFDGVDDYIEVPYNSALNGSTSSYTLWCRADALDANYGSPLTTRHGSPRAGFSVYKQPDNYWRLMIGQSSDAWSTDSSAIPVDQGNWVFISVLVESSTASLFVDGELAQNLSNLVLNSSSPLRFGAGRTESTADYFFNGAIDDVRIYNRVLSVSEISALYALESQPFDQFSPVQIVDSNVTGVSSLGSHALFQKTDGSLWAMGANEYGQLGDGTTTDRHTPVQIVDENVTTFSAGGDHSRFVQADGSLWAMGRNNYGQLGMSDWPTDGMTAYYPFDGDALDRSGNGYDGLVVGATLTPDRFGNPNMAYSFDGSDDRIRIGDQALNGATSFTITMWIKFLNGAIHFFSGANTSRDNEFLLAVGASHQLTFVTKQSTSDDSSFSVTTWYENWKQLSITRSNTSSALKVYVDGQFSESFSMANGAPSIDSNGLWLGADQDSVGGGWQSDNMFFGSMDEVRIFNRELSSAEIYKLYELENRASPVKVVNSGVAEVASGLSHGYYLTTTGDLWAMGWNADGQLGDGTVTNRSTPVQVLNGSDVSQVSAGSKEGYFIKEDGTAWAMGRNDFGQLGNADTADQSTPAIVFGWEENASVSVARFVSNGLVTLGNAIYCVGGYTSSNVYKLLEKYDHQTGQWENLQSMTESREGLASAVLDGKIYALGGVGFASSEIYDPVVNSWSVGPNLPEVIHRACAITYNNRLFLMGGQRADNAYLDQVLEFNSTSNQWITRSPMPNVGSGHKLIVFQNAVWAIGVSPDSSFAKVDRYVPETDTWFSMPDMITGRAWGVTWVLGDRLYVGGGSNGSYLKSIESYDPVTNQWQEVGELPQSSYASGFAQLGNKLFLVGGGVSTGVYSNKLYVSDMQAVREIRGNSSTGHTLLVRADNSFGAMGQNNYGQLGDNSLADKSYPVSLMNTYDVVMTSGTGGSATGAGIYYAGAQVTIGASPSPGYLFGNWSGDFSSTDANDSFIINADYAIAASFSQDTEDDDDDGLNNYYELAVLGSNPLSGDTDGDGFSDLDENATGLDPTVANTALYNHLSNLVELARSEGNATGYQAGLSDGNASGILYVQNNKTLYDLYTQEEANSSANERYADGVTEGNASGIAWASQNWSLYSLYTGEEKNASASTQYSLGLTEGNTTGYAQGLLDGNASGIAWGQANRTDYHFYTGGEVNSSAEAEYTLGYSEGNTTGYAQGLPDGNVSGVDYAFEQRADYDLFTQVEINASADTQYNTGYAEGNASGYSRGFSEGNATAVSLGMEQPETANLFTEEENIVTKQESVTRGFSSVQADLAREGLSLKAYYERIKDLQVPHLSDWHYHSTMGWLWTDRETFPFIYRAQSETHTGRWLYFSNRKEHRATPLYDYALGEWSMIPGSL